MLLDCTLSQKCKFDYGYRGAMLGCFTRSSNRVKRIVRPTDCVDGADLMKPCLFCNAKSTVDINNNVLLVDFL